MKKFLLAIAVLMALACAGFFDGHKAQAASFAPYGCPPELASLAFPEPRACIDLQSWWQPVFDPATFATNSMHVHDDPPFPYGEQLILPAAGQGYSWPFLGQWHNQVGGSLRSCRGGGFQFPSTIPSDPSCAGKKITEQDMRLAGAIPIPASVVNSWRSFTGQRENRFTNDTSSADGGKRQYESCACNAFLNAPGKPVKFTVRGWYQPVAGSGEYVNLTVNTPFRASTLSTIGLPNTISYSLAQGATMASAYIDADLHHGSKGLVLFEFRTGSSGTFTLPTLTPGLHRLLIGGIERVGAGASGGFANIPFNVQ